MHKNAAATTQEHVQTSQSKQLLAEDPACLQPICLMSMTELKHAPSHERKIDCACNVSLHCTAMMKVAAGQQRSTNNTCWLTCLSSCREYGDICLHMM